jgi:hypothetical protein
LIVNAKVDSIEDPLHISKIIEYMRERFMVLRAIGSREVINEMEIKGDAQDETAEDEESDGEPSKTRMRWTQSDADIQGQNNICLKALLTADNVRMFSCTFENFSKRADIESLFGKVTLVLTDPPCDTRREAGASNSDNDKLSLSTVKLKAYVI